MPQDNTDTAELTGATSVDTDNTNSDTEKVIDQADKPDVVRELIKAERDAAAAAKNAAEVAKAEQQKVAAAAEKLTAERDAALAAAQAAQVEALRVKVAVGAGIPVDQAHRLSGGTEDELKADAESLLKSFKSPASFDRGAKPSSAAADMNTLLEREYAKLNGG